MDSSDDVNAIAAALGSDTELDEGSGQVTTGTEGLEQDFDQRHGPVRDSAAGGGIDDDTTGANSEEFVTASVASSSVSNRSEEESFHSADSGSDTDNGNTDVVNLPPVGVAVDQPVVDDPVNLPAFGVAVEVGPIVVPLPMAVDLEGEFEVEVDEESDEEWFVVEPHADQVMDEFFGAPDQPISDDSSSDSEQEVQAAARLVTFDQAAPSAHTYLGEDLDDIHGRVIFDEGSIVTLPALMQSDVVLMPGQTMPMHLNNTTIGAVMRTAVEQQKTVAVLHYKGRQLVQGERRAMMAEIGTTAEVLSINTVTDTLLASVRTITKGRQRFKLLEANDQAGGFLTAKVEILPEIMHSDALEGAIPPSHYRPRAMYRGVKSNCESLTRKRRVHDKCSYFTHWPAWVYSQYSPPALMQRLREEMRQWGDQTSAIMSRITCPDQLAYWLADNIPMTTENKLQLLAMKSCIQRLRYELHLIQRYKCLSCRDCDAVITKKSDVFSLSLEGPMGTYVNPHGSVHETLTVHKAKNLSLRGRPSKQFSWFPGYAWTIANCRTCGSHKGWRFTSDVLQPPMFYGLTRNGLIPGISPDPNSSNNVEEGPLVL